MKKKIDIKSSETPRGSATPTDETVSETQPKSKKQSLFERWRSNRSKKIPIGRSFQTRDEFIEGGIPKEGADDKQYYRRVFAVETNELDEMVIAKSTTSEKGTTIPDYNGVSKVRPFVFTKDNEGKPIKKGRKFIENPPAQDITSEVAEKILKKAIKHPNDYKKVQDMKKRRQKKGQE